MAGAVGQGPGKRKGGKKKHADEPMGENIRGLASSYCLLIPPEGSHFGRSPRKPNRMMLSSLFLLSPSIWQWIYEL